MMIFLFCSHGASSSASGTRVVFPAPGGATRTAALLPASVRARSSSTASIGRGVSKLRGKDFHHSSCPASCRASTSFLASRKQDVDGRDKPGHDEISLDSRFAKASTPDRRAADAFVDKAERGHVFGA